MNQSRPRPQSADPEQFEATREHYLKLQELGWTQRAIANAIGKGLSTISNGLNGHSTLTEENAKKILALPLVQSDAFTKGRRVATDKAQATKAATKAKKSTKHIQKRKPASKPESKLVPQIEDSVISGTIRHLETQIETKQNEIQTMQKAIAALQSLC